MQMIRDMQAAPTEIDLVKDTIGVLTNSTAPSEEILIALEALQSLMEPIDNANGDLTYWPCTFTKPLDVLYLRRTSFGLH